jgi:ribonuclease HI
MTTFKVITDASVAKNEAGKYKGRLGILLLDPNDRLINFYSEGVGRVTSNEGEYMALEAGMSHLERHFEANEIDPKKHKVDLYTDSSLVFNQIMKNFKTKKKKFKIFQDQIVAQCKKYKEADINWHPREADLATMADFATKHPRRTRSIYKRYKNEPVGEALEKVCKFLLKDENEKAREDHDGE